MDLHAGNALEGGDSVFGEISFARCHRAIFESCLRNVLEEQKNSRGDCRRPRLRHRLRGENAAAMTLFKKTVRKANLGGRN